MTSLLVIAIATLWPGLLIAIALLSSERGRRRDLIAERDRALDRVTRLEAMLDELRARELQVSPPETVTPAPAQPTTAPLPPIIAEALEDLEDPTGELEELARHAIALGRKPEAIAEELLAS